MTARVALLVLLFASALLQPSGQAAVNAGTGRTLNVPADHPTLDAAITASQPGDLILLAAGTYPGEVVVPEDKPGITIRGVDRNTVVFDGATTRLNAIEVEADDVTLENMSAHSFADNGFYWDSVEGFVGRYLTVWNVGLYGIYAIESRDGVIEDSYVSGAADAAFYIGECQPCDTVLRRITAVLSAVGYSGTNAGGNLVLEDSAFENNETGILPNSFDVGLQPPPQRAATFRRNVVRGSGSVPVPRRTPLGGFHGIGIGIVGGVDNVVESNEVTGSARYGIVVATTLDRETSWVPSGNRVTGNRVSGSGLADLALARGSGAGNCFEGNQAATIDPAEVAGACSAAGDGSDAVAAEIVRPPPQMLEGLPQGPDHATMPSPAAQPTMPASGPSEPAPSEGLELTVVAAIAGSVAVLVALSLLMLRRRRSVPRTGSA